MIDNSWTLTKLPPIGHADVAEFAHLLFDTALRERERLGKPQDFYANYAIYRGAAQRTVSGRRGFPGSKGTQTPVNLYFANIERTVSNITARNPTGEVVDMDGYHDDAENIMSLKLKKWWKDTDQQLKTKATAREMEIYGLTVEKPVRDADTNTPDSVVTDVYSFLPAPGNWGNISLEAPYICYIYDGMVDKIEKDFGVSDIAVEDTYALLGMDREDVKPQGYRLKQTIGNYGTPMTLVPNSGVLSGDNLTKRGIVIEVWVRDTQTETVTESRPVLSADGIPLVGDDGQLMMEEYQVTDRRCPDGIRKITISRSADPTKNGWVVLDDSPNPNINYRHLSSGNYVKDTYPWGRLPVYTANSYKDGISIYGFSAAEQVGDLLEKINIIVSKLIAYVINVMTPPLIVQQNCGITREMIESSIQKAGRLILMPTTPNARIEFLQIPNLPVTFFQVLEMIVRFFDRVYQIEDADRGEKPAGVIAASAIVALQERNQVLMQTKTSSIDFLVEQRSKWAIGLWQNWGIEEDYVDINGERTPFRPVNYINRKFNFVVESGSMTPRTSLQLQEMAKWLYEVKAIGQKGLLESLSWPNWKEEIARTAESQLDQALLILVDAGLPEESAIEIRDLLMHIRLQAQGGKKTSQNQPTQPKSLVPPSSSVQSGA